MDINTPQGMEAAKKWMRGHLALLNEGGVWGIPRSCAVYQFNKAEKKATRVMGCDPSTERVLREIGYTIEESNDEPAR